MLIILVSVLGACSEGISDFDNVDDRNERILGQWKLHVINEIYLKKDSVCHKEELLRNEILNITQNEIEIYDYPGEFMSSSRYIQTNNVIYFNDYNGLAEYTTKFFGDTLVMTEYFDISMWSESCNGVDSAFLEHVYVKSDVDPEDLEKLRKTEISSTLLRRKWKFLDIGSARRVGPQGTLSFDDIKGQDSTQFADQLGAFEIALDNIVGQDSTKDSDELRAFDDFVGQEYSTQVSDELNQLIAHSPKILDLKSCEGITVSKRRIRINEDNSLFTIFTIHGNYLYLIPTSECLCDDIMLRYELL